jgi:hypothetical protein
MKLIAKTVIVLVAGMLLSLLIYKFSPKTKECPDAWIANQQPGLKVGPRQYLVFEGRSKGTWRFDLEWIQKNCRVTGPSEVQ